MSARRSSDGVAGAREPRTAVGVRDAKVDHLDRATRGDQHILRLQIAVHDANVMRGAQRARDIGRDHDGARRVERTALDLAPQRVPFDVFRGDEQASVNLLERIDGRHRGMRDGRGRSRFAAQPLAQRRVAILQRRQRLQRDAPSEASVARAIDDPHAAAADLEFDLV
jgi:hypothetical protein